MMHAFNALASLVLLLSAGLAQASVRVTKPTLGTFCATDSSCLVQWDDNGESPLLGDIGECEVSLYTADLQFAQSLPSVNVATTNSFRFTPNPATGIDGEFRIAFEKSSIDYKYYSGTFTVLSGLN